MSLRALEIARSAIVARQTEIEMIGHNVANAETPGYRPREVEFEAALREAIDRINPNIPQEAREEAFRKILRLDSPSLVGANRIFHRMLRDGVEVEYRRKDGSIAGDGPRQGHSREFRPGARISEAER